jgi:thioredoxin reductase (NADPH)
MADIKVFGADWCPDCRRSKRFLAEQRIAYDWVDLDRDPGAKAHVERLNGGAATIPTIVFPDGSHVAEPTNEELADKLGLRRRADRDRYDLLILGAGPTGLTAAIYAAREGIDALVIERSALGGQAGVTERIDNYPGFPDGVGGAELAERMEAQAKGYGVELLSALGVQQLDRERDEVFATTTSGDRYRGRAALVATGTSYRRLGVPGEAELIGAGIHLCATCDGPFYRGAQELLVIGGGNSGVEEGLFLSQFADRIRLVEFMPELGASARLRDIVGSNPTFTIHTNTEIVGFRKAPTGKLASVVARDRATGAETRFRPAAAFEFIGLDPNTGFLRGSLELDPRGFVVTGRDHATSVPGVFAAGDVRSGSVKQLASAAGEGASALLAVRRYLEGSASWLAAVG